MTKYYILSTIKLYVIYLFIPCYYFNSFDLKYSMFLFLPKYYTPPYYYYIYFIVLYGNLPAFLYNGESICIYGVVLIIKLSKYLYLFFFSLTSYWFVITYIFVLFIWFLDLYLLNYNIDIGYNYISLLISYYFMSYNM